MARDITTRRAEKQRKSKISGEMPLKPINYKIIIGGALLIVASYIILASNNTVYGFIPLNVVPILLFIGYIVIIPFGIMYRGKKKTNPGTGSPQNPNQQAAK